jgi:hypothetical protein
MARDLHVKPKRADDGNARLAIDTTEVSGPAEAKLPVVGNPQPDHRAPGSDSMVEKTSIP